MSISTIFNTQCIRVGVVGTKEEFFEQLIAIHKDNGSIADVAQFRQDIAQRESQGSTCIGSGICIPHAKSSTVVKPSVALCIAKQPIQADAPDGNPCNLFFMIAAPDSGDFHLDTLSALMRLLMNESFRSDLLQAKTAEQVLQIIINAEKQKEQEQQEQQQVIDNATKQSSIQENTTTNGQNGQTNTQTPLDKAPQSTTLTQQNDTPTPSTQSPPIKFIVAVTACPTGIAHTYMAAEALETKAKELGVVLKAETNGSGGAKNILTPQEIAQADAVIIAADTTVPMARFDGKPLIKVKVGDGVRKATQLIQQCIDGKAEVYKHTASENDETKKSTTKENFGRQLYKHLMSGVSHMLPFVIGGGIMIALAFLIDTLAGGAQDSSFGSNTPAASWFNTIGGAAFAFMLPVLAGYIAYSIADRPGLAVGFVGGALAVSGATFTTPENWVSGGFLGALLAGFAAGYLTLGLRKVCDQYLPKSLEGIKPVLIYPLVGIILIGLLMSAINPLMGAINTGIEKGLNAIGDEAKIPLGILLGGMMAIDMGGPINKAAYVFGTAAITYGQYEVMAAVMIGGMVPPIAIALATTFFRRKWTENEIKAGPVNYIM